MIGGSLGLALARSEGYEVVGFDVDPAASKAAEQRGAIHRCAPSEEDAVENADAVVLAMPVQDAVGTVKRIDARLREGAAVTDVGSAKGRVVAEASRRLGGRFVGGHPMAGSERQGIEAADARLFEGATWILTPTAATSHDAYDQVSRLVAAAGARPVALDPDLHDELVARLSHVPQLVASAVVEMAVAGGDREAMIGLAGGGFRDVTRIASSDPDLWVGILRANSQAVIETLSSLRTRLAALERDVETERWEALRGFLGAAREARRDLFAKRDLEEPVVLSMTVPDRPGVLAEVTTAAGRLGANIEDLRIAHSTEGGQGRLEVIISGRERAEALAAALISLGYVVHRGQVT